MNKAQSLARKSARRAKVERRIFEGGDVVAVYKPNASRKESRS